LALVALEVLVEVLLLETTALTQYSQQLHHQAVAAVVKVCHLMRPIQN
jgi:hypothetical protein